MTKLYDVDPFSFFKSQFPSALGFDHMLKNIQETQKHISKACNFPPYNVKKVDDNKYVIELAVAGFGKQDIDLEFKEGVLTIKGNTTLDSLLTDGVDVTYLHKGIADRAFTRSFTLADTIEIKNAEIINGILKVWLEHFIPEDKKPKKIPINDSPSQAHMLTEGKK